MNTTAENGEPKSAVLVEEEQKPTPKEEDVIPQTEAVDIPANAETIAVTATVANEVVVISLPVLESESKTIGQDSEKGYLPEEDLETEKKEMDQVGDKVDAIDNQEKKAEVVEIQTLEIAKSLGAEIEQPETGM